MHVINGYVYVYVDVFVCVLYVFEFVYVYAFVYVLYVYVFVYVYVSVYGCLELHSKCCHPHPAQPSTRILLFSEGCWYRRLGLLWSGISCTHAGSAECD